MNPSDMLGIAALIPLAALFVNALSENTMARSPDFDSLTFQKNGENIAVHARQKLQTLEAEVAALEAQLTPAPAPAEAPAATPDGRVAPARVPEDLATSQKKAQMEHLRRQATVLGSVARNLDPQKLYTLTVDEIVYLGY